MDPGVVQVALLNEVNENIIDLISLLTEEKQAGIVEPYLLHITTTIHVTRALKPWFSALFFNDGPNMANALTNPTKNSLPHQIKPGESYMVQFNRALISDVQLWCDSGTATIRLDGVR